jgi:hypothetical protein
MNNHSLGAFLSHRDKYDKSILHAIKIFIEIETGFFI